MSGEGKYGRLPKPKDRSRHGVSVGLGDVTLEPTHDKAAEYEEETGSPYHAHAKPAAPAPEESLMAKLGRMGQQLGASVSGWSRFTGDDKKDEE